MGNAKEKTVAPSSPEGEYMALTKGSKDAYLRNLLFELTNALITVPLYNDSQSALKLVHNPVFHEKSKHIDIKFHFIREAVMNDNIVLY